MRKNENDSATFNWPLNGDESDDGDERRWNDADERRSVKTEVENVAKRGTDEAEVSQEGDDAEDRSADDGSQRIDGDQEHQAAIQSSGNLEKQDIGKTSESTWVRFQPRKAFLGNHSSPFFLTTDCKAYCYKKTSWLVVYNVCWV